MHWELNLMKSAFYDQITYVIVDTIQHELGQLALQRSQKAFPLKNVVIFSDKEEPWTATKFVKINRINSLAEYSRILLQDVVQHVETEHCLIIQYDGFVINPDIFSKLFLLYDYVGATWPHRTLYNVGNGGFCLRSRRLMEIVAKNFQNHDLRFPEDHLIARNYRAILEDQFNLRFAPADVANHFSQELTQQPWPTFGFHGFHLLPQVYKKNLPELFEKMSPTLSAGKDALMQKACRELGAHALEALKIYQQKALIPTPSELCPS
jgi:hypothetical protein